MKLLFLGAGSTQAQGTLAALLERGLVPEAVLIAEQGVGRGVVPLSLPVSRSTAATGLAGMSAAKGVPAYVISRDTLGRFVEKLGPERVLVSCCPFRIPKVLLDMVPLGWMNVHPSLLPFYRGPSPLFWQLRDGLEKIGVTLHRMVPTFDMGPILAQRAIRLSGGMSGATLSHQAGREGAALYLEWADQAPAGCPLELEQNPVEGSYQSFPAPGDFMIDPGWSAHRVFNFVRGVGGLGQPLLRLESGQTCPVLEAVSCHLGHRACPEVQVSKNMRMHRCYNGAVLLRIQETA
ncbi:MAG: hypothetical protein GY703_17605 [Gammaproteobacteria bacterium]|nr:hypothetical protein [Gammaproteobacteria bacterium]